MGPLLVFLLGGLAAVGIGVGYHEATESLRDQHEGTPRRPNEPPVSSTTPTPDIYTTETPVTSLRISLSDSFERRAADLSRIVQRSTELNHRGRPPAIWNIDPQSATDNYNGATQRAIHHFVPGDLLRDTFYREINRRPRFWRYLVQMLRVGVENLLTVSQNSPGQLAVSAYEISIASWTLDLFDERVRSQSTSIYEYEFISQGLDTLYGVFYWSPFNLFIGPLPQHRQPEDQGNKLDVQLMPIMTPEWSRRLRNLYEYFDSERNLDPSAVLDYITLTSVHVVPTSSGPWRQLTNTLDDYFREVVRISRRQNDPPLSEAIDSLSGVSNIMMTLNETFQIEVIQALQTCERCKNAINSMDKNDCKRKKCPFFIKKKNTYYILDVWEVTRTWIKSLLKPKDGVTPRFSMPDEVIKNYFNCDDDKDDGSGGCLSSITQTKNDVPSQDIEFFDKAFQNPNPDIEYKNMKHLPNRYLQPFGNPMIMRSFKPFVVYCLVNLHNNPLRAGMVSTKNRRRRYRVDEDDIDVKYNSQYLLKLVQLIHQDTNESVDELTIFKQIVTANISPKVAAGFNRVCNGSR